MSIDLKRETSFSQSGEIQTRGLEKRRGDTLPGTLNGHRSVCETERISGKAREETWVPHKKKKDIGGAETRLSKGEFHFREEGDKEN